MNFITVKLHLRNDIANDFIRADFCESVFLNLFEKLFVMTLASAYDGSEDINPFSVKSFADSIDYLLERLTLDRVAAVRAMLDAALCKKQSHEVINLCHSADSGAGIMGDGFLFDGDGGRKSFYLINVRTFDTADELPRVSGESFNEAALTFGINRVECEGRFSGAGNAGDDHEFIAWNLKIDVLKIVDACAADCYSIYIRHWRNLEDKEETGLLKWKKPVRRVCHREHGGIHLTGLTRFIRINKM